MNPEMKEVLMIRLHNPEKIPPGGFRWTDPETEIEVKGKTWNELLTHVQLFRAANGGDLTDGWRERLETEICQQNQWGPSWCGEEPELLTKGLTFGDLMVFVNVLKNWIGSSLKAGKPLWVDQAEANRRAAICAECPHNVEFSGGCTACGRLLTKITEVIGQRTTPYDDRLKACEICKCENKSQIHADLEILAEGVNENMPFPDFCWKRDAIKLKR